MKKSLLVMASSLAVLLFSNVASATPVCDGSAAGGDKSVTEVDKFIVNSFTMKCSSNVFLNYDESDTVLAVGAASKKGKNVFSGSSAGGQVKPASACAADPCTANDSAGASSAALNAGSST